ncbi:hypothetical protein CDAR_193541 [Caerostris darwini]|uniref:Uncharacterized protein n=1 Tax=Caerostris darwini TaxID=1538125 RepID=A0AAV4RN44_9ARAC|nr:hypothetical protein CDAR_193541 [Caerostris darwini]
MIMDDHTYTREKEDEMEVTAEGSLSPFQDQLPPASPQRSGRPIQSPVEVCTMLQNIQNELSNAQEELASYQICVNLKSSSETPGLSEILRNAMDLVENKIACHLHKVRLIGSCPIKTCLIHYPPSTSHTNFQPNSLPKQNPLKRATADDSDFQLPPKRNTVKAPTFFSPNTISTSNKFMNLDKLTEPDPHLPQAPKIPPIMLIFPRVALSLCRYTMASTAPKTKAGRKAKAAAMSKMASNSDAELSISANSSGLSEQENLLIEKEQLSPEMESALLGDDTEVNDQSSIFEENNEKILDEFSFMSPDKAKTTSLTTSTPGNLLSNNNISEVTENNSKDLESVKSTEVQKNANETSTAAKDNKTNTVNIDLKKRIQLSSTSLSNEERIKLRAQRFNITSSEVPKIDKNPFSLKKSTKNTKSSQLNQTVETPSMEVLRKRADRFGESVSTIMIKLDEQQKLLKRKMKFQGGDVTDVTGLDEKKQKRAERFRIL